MYPTRLEEDYILRNMLDPREKNPVADDQSDYRQLSLFEDYGMKAAAGFERM